MRIAFTIFLLFGLPFSTFPQKTDIDKVIEEIHFGKDTLKSVFQWVANNIDYDVNQMRSGDLHLSSDSILPDVIENRKGVCQHYAELFHAICSELGYESYVITGYTIQKNKLGNSTHAWNAVRTGEKWYMYDPTWAGGFVDQDSFKKHYNSFWYKVSPKTFIKTHIPFDPIWQFLEKPLTNYQIEQGKQLSNDQEIVNFQDSISLLLRQDELTRQVGQLNRMITFGVTNTFLRREVSDLVKDIVVIEFNQKVWQLNNGVALLRAAIDDYNHYLNAKNNYFEGPIWSDDKIRLEVDAIQVKIRIAYTSFKHINPFDFMVSKKFAGNLKVTDDLSYYLNKNKTLFEFSQMVTLNLNVAENLMQDLQKEMSFINKYLNTSESARLAIFEQ